MLRSTLDTFSAGEVLWLLGRSGVTGTLRVSAATPGVVHLRDGFVTWAATGDDDVLDCLARARLVPAGGDSSGAADQVEAALRDGPEAQRIHDTVRAATEEAMFELASWDEGELWFEETAAHRFGDSFCFPVVAVLDAVRRLRTRWSELEARIGGADAIVVQAPAEGDEGDCTISRTQWRLLGAVDGHRDILALARALDLGLVTTGELVVALLDAGLLCLLDESTPRQEPAGPLPQRAAHPSPEPAPAPARANGARHLTAVPTDPSPSMAPVEEPSFESLPSYLPQPSLEPAAIASPLLTAVAPAPTLVAVDTFADPTVDATDASAGLAVLARELGLPEADYVNAGDKPSRDLIIRLLSAVKEL
jgi:hypothetical protein